jgi:putative ATPase
MQTDIFSQGTNKIDRPWAYELRPQTLEQYIGQDNVLHDLKRISSKKLPHLVLFGPPGCGKTTLAKIIANQYQLELFEFNAVLSGVAELRKLIKAVIDDSKMMGKKSIIFIDEIHRFNKSQQDALLPYLEQGDFILIGATTEYPQTSLNPAILSRIKTLELTMLSEENLKTILQELALKKNLEISDQLVDLIAKISHGDARSAISTVEFLYATDEKINQLNDEELSLLKKKLVKNNQLYDKSANRHYDVISAFIKSVRGSDVDSALLWLAVMLDGGEQPEFIARRLIILASEDIGLADSHAIQIATNAHYAVKNIGMPEARIPLSQATIYLAMANKSNSAYKAIDAALAYVKENETLEVPTHLRNHHPDKENYLYPHAYKSSYIKQKYSYGNKKFYEAKFKGEENKLNQSWLSRTQEQE